MIGGAFDRGAKRLGLSAGATKEYRHEHGAAVATAAFSEKLSDEQLARMLMSPLIGIACDESTDIAVTERMDVYVYYIFEGNVRCEFFGMVELHPSETDSDSTFDEKLRGRYFI